MLEMPHLADTLNLQHLGFFGSGYSACCRAVAVCADWHRTCQQPWRLDRAAFVAGHSLGEYSALCAAGTLSLADTARLLRIRGKAMQAAVPVGQGAMAAVLGLDAETAAKVADDAAQGDVCQLANENDPTQNVLSGSKAAIERAVVLAKEAGAKRALP